MSRPSKLSKRPRVLSVIEMFCRLEKLPALEGVRLQEHDFERGQAGFAVRLSAVGQAEYATRESRRRVRPDSSAAVVASNPALQSFVREVDSYKASLTGAMLASVFDRGASLIDIAVTYDDDDLDRELDTGVAPDGAFLVVRFARVSPPVTSAKRARKPAYTSQTITDDILFRYPKLAEALMTTELLDNDAARRFQAMVLNDELEADLPTRVPDARAERVMREIDMLWRKGCRAKTEIVAHLSAAGLVTLEGKAFTVDNVHRALVHYLLWRSDQRDD
jgi:hypothetical protein